MKSRISQLIDDFHNRELPEPIPRDHIVSKISGKAEAIVGMRQAGKISCCYQKMTELISKGTQKEEILYLNFEDDRLFEFEKKNLQEIVDVYYSKFPHHKDSKCHFFFDEIQRIDQWEPFVRQLLETENVQVYFTGSSSKLLVQDSHTGLKGRSKPVEVFPLNFKEFLRYHKLFNSKPRTFNTQTIAILRKAVKDYLEIGGFPEVQTMDCHSRVETLQSYIDSVILKDIVERHKVSNIKALKYLVRSIMSSTGEKFSVNKFYNKMKTLSVKCTKNSLYDYLDYLIEAFVFFKVPIHSRSQKARQINPAKIYTIDTGLINAMTFRTTTNLRPMLENMVFMHLRRRGFDINYIKTKNGHELDFLVKNKDTQERKLIQTCWDLTDIHTLKNELKGLRSAMQENSIPTGTIVTWDDEIDLFNEIKVTPIWKWLFN